MPIVKDLMDSLVAKYGTERGQSVYYAMEASGKGPFSAGGKYRHLHEQWAERNGVQPVGAVATKKPAPSKKTRRARSQGARRRR